MNRNLVLLLSGQLVSQIGDKFHMLAVAFLVLKTSGSTAQMGLVLFCSVFPDLFRIGYGSGRFVHQRSKYKRTGSTVSFRQRFSDWPLPVVDRRNILGRFSNRLFFPGAFSGNRGAAHRCRNQFQKPHSKRSGGPHDGPCIRVCLFRRQYIDSAGHANFRSLDGIC